MKKIIAPILFTFLVFFSFNGFSEDPPSPPPAHGENSNQPGGNAPIGGGLFILIGLGAAYGGKKIYDMNKEKLEE